MVQTSSYDVVVVGAIATVMRVTKEPTEITPAKYSFSGVLETLDGTPLPGETVNLVVDGAVVNSQATSLDGRWGFSFLLEPGATYIVKATFPGTVDYEASETPTYSVTPSKLVTVMEVTTPPPTSIDPGVTFVFAGILKEQIELVGIAGATVDLYIKGVKESTTTTGADGAWAFDVTLTTAGTYTIYAEFPGDTKYLGCSEKLSAGWLAPAGLLAVAGLVGIAWLGR